MPSNTQQNERQKVKHSAQVCQQRAGTAQVICTLLQSPFRPMRWNQTLTAVCHVWRSVPAFITALCPTPKLCFSTESGQAGLHRNEDQCCDDQDTSLAVPLHAFSHKFMTDEDPCIPSQHIDFTGIMIM